MDSPTTSVPKSRLEINFIRLLDETQQMANGNKPKDWSFTKNVSWLLEKIPEMEKSPNSPSDELIKHYKRQVEFLKGVLDAEEVLVDVDTTTIIPHGVATTDQSNITQQILHRTQSSTNNKLRQQLFDLGEDDEDISLRKRNILNNSAPDNFQSELLNEEQRRDKLVEDMVAMTREWKEQSLVANKIIKKDIEVVGKSSKIADVNQDHLKTESNRLSEYNKRACNCGIWLMILLICFVFIGMVLFIRIFPKRV